MIKEPSDKMIYSLFEEGRGLSFFKEIQIPSVYFKNNGWFAHCFSLWARKVSYHLDVSEQIEILNLLDETLKGKEQAELPLIFQVGFQKLSPTIVEWLSSKMNFLNMDSQRYQDMFEMAIEQNDVAFVRESLRQGFKVNKPIMPMTNNAQIIVGATGENPLVSKVMTKEMLAVFLNAGADVWQLSSRGDRAFDLLLGKRWDSQTEKTEGLKLLCKTIKKEDMDVEAILKVVTSSRSKSDFKWRLPMLKKWGFNPSEFQMTAGGGFLHFLAYANSNLVKSYCELTKVSDEEKNKTDLLGLTAADYLFMNNSDKDLFPFMSKHSIRYADLWSKFEKFTHLDERMVDLMSNFLIDCFKLQQLGLKVNIIVHNLSTKMPTDSMHRVMRSFFDKVDLCDLRSALQQGGAQGITSAAVRQFQSGNAAIFLATLYKLVVPLHIESPIQLLKEHLVNYIDVIQESDIAKISRYKGDNSKNRRQEFMLFLTSAFEAHKLNQQFQKTPTKKKFL